jgi:hypothetical protein
MNGNATIKARIEARRVVPGLSRDANHVYTANYDGIVRVVPGVTGIVGTLDKSNFLIPWAKRLTAQAAIDNRSKLEEWVELSGRDGAVSMLTGVATKARDKAGEVGSEVHALADAINRGTPVTVSAEMAPFVDAYREWVARFQPTFLATEEMVYSETHGYAGTFDSIVEIAGKVWLTDIKTAEKGPFEETAIQLAAYAGADWIGRANDTTRYGIPRIDEYGVLKVRPEGAELYPFDVTGDEFEVFLALARATGWRKNKAKTVIGQPVGHELLAFEAPTREALTA